MPSFSRTNMSSINVTNNFIATSNGNNSPITGAKFFKGAAPGAKKSSASVTSMKATIGFDGAISSAGAVQTGNCLGSSPLENNLFLAPQPKTSTFRSNEALSQAGKPVPDEPATKFVVPSSTHGNGGCLDHLINALAACRANNSAFVEKQRSLHPATSSPLRNEVWVTFAAPRDFPTLGGNNNVGKASYDSSKNKKSYKDVANSGINQVGQSTQIWTRCLLSDQEWSQGIQSSEGAKWQTFKEVGEALLEHDHYVRSLLLNTHNG